MARESPDFSRGECQYFFSATWYAFLLALLLQFGRQLKKGTFLFLTAVTAGFVFAFWWKGESVIPIPMDFETGKNIIIGSVLLFVGLIGFCLYKLRELYSEIEVM